jgi:hypothetical protein
MHGANKEARQSISTMRYMEMEGNREVWRSTDVSEGRLFSESRGRWDASSPFFVQIGMLFETILK